MFKLLESEIEDFKDPFIYEINRLKTTLDKES